MLFESLNPGLFLLIYAPLVLLVFHVILLIQLIKNTQSGTFKGICIIWIVIYMILLIIYGLQISRETEGLLNIISFLDIGFFLLFIPFSIYIIIRPIRNKMYIKDDNT